MRTDKVSTTVFLLFGLFCATLESKSSGGAGSSSSSSQNVVHHGVIREDAGENDEVKLDVPIYVRNRKALAAKEICGYTIYKAHSDLPFKIVDVDRRTGSAKVVLGPGAQLDYEQKHEYRFEIAAHDCDNNHAEREKVHIEVEDVNEYAPTWPKSSLSAEAVEGRVYDYLIRLEAVDKDGIEGNTKICQYHILTPNVPFEVDADGYLRNTEAFDYNTKSQYVIEVTAEDCGGRTSDKAIVTIDVKPSCHPSWSEVPDRVEFTPRSSRKLIADSAELELCDDPCNLTQIAVTIKLTTEHIGKGCDRDTYSLQSQRKLCGASEGSVDLLPSPSLGSWTKDLPTDDGQESDQIFAFDGKTTAIEIPPTKVDYNLGEHFTILTWMKHDADEDSETSSQDVKEHILCHSDGDGMNRHHYSVFIHNCRLVLLLRREPGDYGTINELQPAEWRWNIPEVCDGKWHHYAISVEFPEVRLYIDGQQFVEMRHNPEIVDDWPLHQSRQVHFTKLVVGACWQGGKHKMGQYFRGYLAGLSILSNRTESDTVIRCLNNCQEKLDFTAIDTMDNTVISMNSDRTTITISGSDIDSVEMLLHNIGYINTRTFPTPGHRPVTIETKATCSNGKQLAVDMATMFVIVLDAERPTITLTSTKSRAIEEHELSRGVKVFPDLVINAQTKAEEQELKSKDESKEDDVTDGDDPKDRFQLDSCLIRVDPQLSLAVEHLRYPENLVSQLGMQVDFNEDGLVIAGADKISAYEEVLRGVRYVNSQPEELNSRTFVLSCTELNGRFASNQLETTMLVVRTQPSPAPAHMAVGSDHKAGQQAVAVKVPIAKSGFHKTSDSPQSGIGVAAVIVACVGFVVLIVALGVARIRNAKRHCHGNSGSANIGVAIDDRQEMEWDNSALTITVNPMDQEASYEDELGIAHSARSVDSDSDEECSARDQGVEEDSSEEEEEEVEEPEKVKSRELEWDDSTLSY